MKPLQAEVEEKPLPAPLHAQTLAWVRAKCARWPWYRAVADVSVLLVQQVASTGISAITSVLTARGLGPSGLGLVALAQNVTGLSGSLSNLGVNQTALRYASREMAAGNQAAAFSVLRWAFRQRMALVLAITAVAYAFAPMLANNLWHKPELTRLIRVALPLSILVVLAAVPDVFFQAARKFHVNAAVRVGESVVALLGITTLWIFHLWTPFAVLIVSTLALGMSALLFLTAIPREALVSRSDSALLWPLNLKRFFRYPLTLETAKHELHLERPGHFAAFLAFSSLLGTLTARMDYLFLGVYRSAADVGIYSIGAQFAIPLTFLVGAMNTALFPRMAGARTHESLMSLSSRTWRLTLLAFLASVLYTGIIPQLVPFILGDRYRASVLVGHLLCLRNCIWLLTCPLIIFGYGLGLARHYVVVDSVKLVVVLVINLCFIGTYGTIVPAIALCANELVSLVAVGLLYLMKVRASQLIEACPTRL